MFLVLGWGGLLRLFYCVVGKFDYGFIFNFNLFYLWFIVIFEGVLYRMDVLEFL